MHSPSVNAKAPVGGDRATLGRRLRARLGPPPSNRALPSVSIVVVSRNGAGHLRTLLDGLIARTDYPRLELIVVDNGSTDESLELLRAAPAPFPVSIVANAHNESFSDANNQGAELAAGELLLFLNNDVEPLEPGWLRELVSCLRDTGAGAVGATLVYPYEGDEGHAHGFAVQHRGLRFRDEDGLVQPVLHEWGADPLDERLGRDVESPVVVAACVLLSASLYRRIGGFARGYRYGSEDIDFCFKVREAGLPVICSGRAVLAHRPGSTRRAVDFERARDRKQRNHRLLLERWGPRLRREHDVDALLGGGMWVQRGREDGAAAATVAEAEAPGACLMVGEADSSLEPAIAALEGLLDRRGWRRLTLRGADLDSLLGLDYDVAIQLDGAGRQVPRPGQFNVLWAAGREPGETERGRYDLVVAGNDPQGLLDDLVAAFEQGRFATRVGAAAAPA
jgi:GT2 family glycosyltransferase